MTNSFNLPMGRMNFIIHLFLIFAVTLCFTFSPSSHRGIFIVLVSVMLEFKFILFCSRKIYSRPKRSSAHTSSFLLSIISFCSVFSIPLAMTASRLLMVREANLVCCYTFDDGNKDSVKNDT